MFNLWPHQQDGVRDIRRAFVDHERVLYVLFCGGGKTVLFSYIAKGAEMKSRIPWIVVHREELVEQVSRTLREFGVQHGIISPNYTPRYDAPCQIVMVQSAKRRIHKYPKPGMLIVDECHHCTAPTYVSLINLLSVPTLGVTATPCQLTHSDKGLGDIYTRMVLGPSPTELTMQGFLSPYRLFSTGNLNRAELPVSHGEFDNVVVERFVRKPQIVGSLVEHYRELCNRAPAVAFFNSVAAAYEGEEMFRRAGYNAATIEGKQDRTERRAIVEAFRRHAIEILCNVDVVSEGFDVPGIECLMDARPSKSLRRVLQSWSRALRADKNNPNKIAYILDHVGNYQEHGLPDDDRQWTLDVGAAKKPQADKLVACPKCLVVGPKRARCEACGYVWPVKEVSRETERVDGKLVEITEREKQDKKARLGAAIRAAKGLADMHRIARDFGYSSGWAWTRWGIEQKRRKRHGQQTELAEPEKAAVYG